MFNPGDRVRLIDPEKLRGRKVGDMATVQEVWIWHPIICLPTMRVIWDDKRPFNRIVYQHRFEKV